jgi:serine/threonine protein kinase
VTQEVFFKRYTIDFDTGWLGEGTFGTVYKAYDNTYSTWKAIKISKVRLIDGKKFSLISEFEATQALPPHPNIANYEAVYQYQMANGMFDYAIMQFYDEGNLKQLLQNNVLNIKQKSDIVNGLIEGISYLHRYKIIHRDIKPSNIMIVKDPLGKFIPKIADFGLSRFVDNDASFMTNSFGGGTLEYSSPEQLYCKPLKYNSDLWSFGVIAFELFTGVRPFGAEDDGSTEAKRLIIYQKIVKAEIPKTIEDVPEPYRKIIKLCLVKDPIERVNNGQELINYINKNNNEGHPSGPDDEKTYILTKEEKTLYETAIQSNQEADSEKFILKYPFSIFISEITDHLKKLKEKTDKVKDEVSKKNAAIEDTDYAIVIKENNLKYYKWFLNKYPNSKNNNVVTLKINELNNHRNNQVLKKFKKYSFLLLIPVFYFIFSFYSKMTMVNIYTKDGKYGLSSKLSGNISEALYDDIKELNSGRYLVSQFKRKFIIDGSGNFVSEYPPKVAKAENESIDPLQKDWVLKANLNELKSARIKYPDSKFIGLINTRIGTITEIESGKLFKKIRNSYNLSELQGFLTKYPNVSKSNAVKGIVIELTKGYSEEKLFGAAQQTYSLVLYNRYLEKFPNGKFRDEAETAISDLEESTKQLTQ